MTMRLLVTLLMLFAGAFPAASQSALAALVGDWSGQGRLAVDPGARTQPGRCRATARLDGDGAGLIIRGRCAVAAASGTMSMRLVDNGGGRVRAAFASSALEGSVQMAGTHDGHRIELVSYLPYAFDGKRFDLRASLVFLDDNRFSMRDWNAPAGTGQWRLVTDLVFSREE